jgi:hypothetical protein
MKGKYEQPWQSLHPGCLILLVDQSGSMEEAFGGTQLGSGKKKCDMVATVLNKLLNEFIASNTSNKTIKPRADVTAIGYNGNGLSWLLPGTSDSKPFTTLPELKASPIRVEKRSTKEMTDTGDVVTYDVEFYVWVEPAANGRTPMCAALARARDVAQQWKDAHPDNYPPVVINITDGQASDVKDETNPVELIEAVKQLKEVETADGATLLFICHLTDKPDAPVSFPSSETSLPNDKLARLLFSLADEIPQTAVRTIKSDTGTELLPGARAFIYNGDAGSVRQMFVFATVSAKDRGNM